MDNGLQATLTVAREGASYGRAQLFRVFLDGTQIGDLKHGETRSWTLAPGEHVVRVQMQWLPGQAATVFCSAGDNITLRVRVRPALLSALFALVAPWRVVSLSRD